MTDRNDLGWEGMAQFVASSVVFLVDRVATLEVVRAHKSTLRIAMWAPDWPPGALIRLYPDRLAFEPISAADCTDRSCWDVRLSAPADTFFRYFMGELGAVRPILLGKIKVAPGLLGMIRATGALWLIKHMFSVYAEKRAMCTAMYQKERRNSPVARSP